MKRPRGAGRGAPSALTSHLAVLVALRLAWSAQAARVARRDRRDAPEPKVALQANSSAPLPAGRGPIPAVPAAASASRAAIGAKEALPLPLQLVSAVTPLKETQEPTVQSALASLWDAGVALALQRRAGDGGAAAKRGGQSQPGGQDLGVTLDDMRPVFYLLAPLTLMCFGFFEFVHRRWSDVDFNDSLELPPEKSMHIGGMFRGIWSLVRPYAVANPQSYRCRAFLAVLLMLSGAQLFIAFAVNLWQGEFWNAFEEKNIEAFWHIMRAYVAIVITWVVVNTYTNYIKDMLEIDWRTFMTRRLQREWLTGQAFYRMQIDQSNPRVAVDNPDQRLQEDVAMFVYTSLNLSFGFLSMIGQLFIFIPILLMLSPSYAFGAVYMPGWLVLLALVYSLVGSFAAHVIGRELIRLGFAKQRYEADFRYHVVQIRDSSEAIALYGSEAVETNILNSKFERVRRVFWELMLYQKRLGFFTSFYFITGWMFPFVVLAPSYFSGEITMGHLFQISSALGQIRESFDWFISTYPTLADFRATSDRLLAFEEVIQETRAKGGKLQTLDIDVDMEKSSGKKPAVLEVREARLSLPGSENPLWVDASLRVEPGEGVLLSAPEGTGKSTFFRALAGVWPYVSGGSAQMQEPLFVPQRSYIPQGSLRQAVAYPHDPSKYGDDSILEALRAVRLEALAPGDDLGAEKNWAMVLSGGEQQRVAIARVLLARPMLVCLDEATSQVGEDGTRDLYATLRKKLPEGAAFMSISHEVLLMRPLHNTHYTAERDPETKGYRWVRVP